MIDRRLFFLVSARVRDNAIAAIKEAPDNYVVTVSPEIRTSEQNDKFHAICTDLSRSGMTFAGERRTIGEWKAIMISGHAVATGSDGELIEGIEGELVAIRESSATMAKGRASSLITYLLAYCDTNGVELTETRQLRFPEERKRGRRP